MAERVRILLVEDDPDDLKLILRSLEEHRLANVVDVARDGEEALEYFFGANASTEPRFVLLDIKLPKIDGLEVLRRLRADERTRTVPVVVLTSSRDEPDVRTAYEYGANSYLCKPVEFNEFVAVVKEVGLYWYLMNETP